MSGSDPKKMLSLFAAFIMISVQLDLLPRNISWNFLKFHEVSQVSRNSGIRESQETSRNSKKFLEFPWYLVASEKCFNWKLCVDRYGTVIKKSKVQTGTEVTTCYWYCVQQHSVLSVRVTIPNKLFTQFWRNEPTDRPYEMKTFTPELTTDLEDWFPHRQIKFQKKKNSCSRSSNWIIIFFLIFKFHYIRSATDAIVLLYK